MLESETNLPEGYERITDILFLKRTINPKLSAKKGLYADANLEPDPQQLYLWSPKEERFYPRWYWSAIPNDLIIPLIKQKLIYGRIIQ